MNGRLEGRLRPRMRLASLPPLFLLMLMGCTSGHSEHRPAQQHPLVASAPPPSASVPQPAPTASAAAPEPVLQPASSASVARGVAAPGAGSGWCLEGFADLDDGNCYLVPEVVREPKSLLVYLHGVIAPHGDTQRIVQGIVARNARSRGYVAYMPRGRRGLGPPPTQDWWSWPTTAEKHHRHAATMIQQWRDAAKSLEQLTGGPFARTYLAGSSNGAFFATALALSGEFEADGYGAMSGGSRAGKSVERIRARNRPPFYVGYGIYDDLKPHPISLGELLGQARWPHRVAAHRTGHGAREVYLDEAFELWQAP